MNWVKLYPAETAEDLARRVASILAHDGMDNAPPYPKDEARERWQLDRGNDWWLTTDPIAVPPGWARIDHRYRDYERLGTVLRVLRVIDGREVSETAPVVQP